MVDQQSLKRDSTQSILTCCSVTTFQSYNVDLVYPNPSKLSVITTIGSDSTILCLHVVQSATNTFPS